MNRAGNFCPKRKWLTPGCVRCPRPCRTLQHTPALPGGCTQGTLTEAGYGMVRCIPLFLHLANRALLRQRYHTCACPPPHYVGLSHAHAYPRNCAYTCSPERYTPGITIFRPSPTVSSCMLTM